MSEQSTRRRRVVRRASITLATIALLLAIGHFVVLPFLIRRQIVAACAAAGIEHVRFDVRRATLWRSELRKLVVGDVDPLRVERIVIRYSPAALWRGRMRSIHVEGLELISRVRDGRAEAGPVRAIVEHFAATAQSIPKQSLQVDVVEFAAAKIVFVADKNEITLPMDGELRRGGDGRIDLRLASAAAGRTFEMIGHYDAERRNGELTVSGHGLDAEVVAGIVTTLKNGVALAAGGLIDLEASLSIIDGGGSIQATLKPQDVWLGPSRAAPNVQGLRGVLHLNAELDGKTASNARMSIENAGFRSAGSDLICEGLTGSMMLVNPAAPRADERQRIGVNHLRLGSAELYDGTVELTLDGWRSIRIAETSWSWLDGTVSTRDATIDPRTWRVASTLTVDKIDLHRLLALLADKRADGEGRISGIIPLVVDWPRIAFGEGELHAEGIGRLSITDTTAIEQSIAQSGAERAQVTQDVLAALKDFEYHTLRAQLKSRTDGLAALVQIAGQGRGGQEQALDLEVRISGIDKLLAAYLGIQDKLSGDN